MSKMSSLYFEVQELISQGYDDKTISTRLKVTAPFVRNVRQSMEMEDEFRRVD